MGSLNGIKTRHVCFYKAAKVRPCELFASPQTAILARLTQTYKTYAALFILLAPIVCQVKKVQMISTAYPPWEAQLREQRFDAAHALAQTKAAATSPLRATKLRTSPACIATLHTPSYRTSQGNKQHTVSSVAFSRDGTMLVSGTADDEEPPGGFLELWDLASRDCVYVQNMRNKAITRVATSSDGCTIASIHDSIFCKKIQIWNVAGEAKMVPEMQGELVEGTGFVSAVAFSRDGERLASGSTAKTVRVWDLRTNKCTACIESDSVVWSVVWSLDNVHVLFGCQDGMIRVCNIAKGVVRVLKGHSPRGQTYKETICNEVISPGVHSLVLTPNGKHAVSGASDNTIKIWDWHSGACMATLEDSEGVACVAVSPDGLMLASGTADKLIRLWRVAD
ncbi:WD40-repeat-containing domain protein [Dunaliella salina]|uniref:WD40-repeat-containing domain protein n=1 Tax=Dunaliella salina TaxID=3046 RepID=A0ABQ7FXM9_DUNSA|nr:WD40-repeat-containing domain protein [Dunaliella salina]|eukprot:KAF5827082.1 WD40-repeat-containing domain protein [Dunaliella salina]